MTEIPPPPFDPTDDPSSPQNNATLRQTTGNTIPTQPKNGQPPPPPPPPPISAGNPVVTMPRGGQVPMRPPVAPPPPPPQAAVPKAQGRAPGQPTLAKLVKMAFDEGFSDIHLGVGERPRMRDRGKMMLLEYPEVDTNTFMSWLREILSEEEIQRFKKELEFDGATQYEFARVRINVFESLRGPGMVLRLIPLKIMTIEQLRLPMIFRDVCEVHKGFILITGPTGSGKSTTLAAMIDHVNKEFAKHIITIEDPIEFVHQSRRSLIKQREVGIHTHEFDNALKASLREDPDIILVGEMRDKGTVNTALKAAQTGHLVFGTLHTNSAVKTLERILTLYGSDEREAMRVAISESLVAIISQGLCRTTDGKRAAFHDIMINTETVKDYIRRGKNDEILELMKDGQYDGMVTSNQSLFALYQEGRITEDTALEMSSTPNELAMMLRGRV